MKNRAKNQMLKNGFDKVNSACDRAEYMFRQRDIKARREMN
jgi:hypothetical protein